MKKYLSLPNLFFIIPLAALAVLLLNPIRVSANTFLQEDFEAYVDGSDPNDWMDTDLRNSMLGNDSLFQVFDQQGNKVFGTTSTATNIHSHYVGVGNEAFTNYQYSGRMQMTSGRSGIGVTFFSDYPNTDTYYRLRRYNNNSFHLSPHGTSVSGIIDTDVVPIPDIWYWFLIEVEDTGAQTNIRAKVWEDGTTEPVDWQIDAFDDTTSRATVGTIGLWSYTAGSKYWDDLSVSPLVPPANDLVLTVNTVGNGTVSIDPDQAQYTTGQVVTLTETADPGWVFSSWSGDLTGSANPETLIITSDLVVTATFIEVTTHTLTVTTEGNGTVVLDPDKPLYNYGDVVTLTAIADSGYLFTGWRGDLNGDANPEMLTITGDASVNAAFIPQPPTLVSEDFEGYIAGSDPLDWMDTDLRNSMVENDSLFKVFDQQGNKVFGTTSTAADIHSHYVGAGSESFTNYRYSGRMRMTASRSGIGVTFFSDYPNTDTYYRLRRYNNNSFHLYPHGLSVSGTTDTGVVPVTDVWYWFLVEVEDTGSQTNIRAKVWQDGTAEPIDWQIDAFDDSATRATAGKIGLWSYAAGSKYWDDLAVTPLVPPANDLVLTVNTVGNGTVSVDPNQAQYTTGQEITLTAEADPGWVFSGWSGDLTGSANPETLIITGDSFVTATFIEVTTHTLTVTTQGNGTVVVDPDKATYNLGETVQLTAQPSQGWVFDSWSGDLTGSTNPATLVMDSDKLVTATFVETITYTLGVNTVGSGAVQVNPAQASYTPGETVTLTALADPGWAFDVWSGDLIGSTNPAALEMDSDKLVTATFLADSTPPVINSVQVVAGSTSAVVTWATDEPSTSSVAYGPSAAYENGTVDDAALVTAHSLTLTGLIPNSLYHFQVRSTDGGGNQAVTADDTFTTSASTGPLIDVWNGLNQDFGHLGDPQQWVNILGNVSDPQGVTSLEYSLNGGPQRALSIGPDNRRLASPGDFNIDIDQADLVNGANQVVITAVDGSSNQSSTTVTVNYTAGTSWSLPYSIDWSTTSDIQQLAQVVDGKWSIQPDGLRIDIPAYDRLVAIGDVTWTDYEVLVPVTIHSVDYAGVGPVSGSPGLGVLMRWQGHTDNPVSCTQPKCGWVPNGNIGWWRFYSPTDVRLEWYSPHKSQAFIPTIGTEYMFRVRVESTPGSGGLYSLKVWEAGQAEPANWNLTIQEDASDIASGSLLLIPHHVDATYGNVTVVSVSGTATYGLTVSTTGSGTVTVNPDQPTYSEGQTVTLTAVADPGWAFDSWSGDLTGSTNPATLVMDSDKLVTATFVIDSTPPVISNVQVAPGTTNAVVSWTTDEPSTSSVAYGPSAAYENGTVDDAALVTSHSLTLTGLTANSLYHFQVGSIDGGGNQAITADDTFTTLDVSNPSGIVSDDFDQCTLDTGVWTYVDPLGDGTVAVAGGKALLSVPAGVNHDPWTTNESVRIMQAANDADFELEVKFDSPLNEQYQIQGLLVEEDAVNYLRFDFYSNNSNTMLYAASFVDGTVQTRKNVAVTGTGEAPQYLRVSRVGDQWTQSYSFDGQSWTTDVSFVHPLVVNSVGVFAGNFGGPPPAHTAVVDYFYNMAVPGVGDVAQHMVTVDVAGNGVVTKSPDKAAYLCGEVVTLTATADPGWTFSGWSGDLSGSNNPETLTVSGGHTITAIFD